MVLPVFPDVHDVLKALLVPAYVDDDHFGTATPANLETRLAVTGQPVFIRVNRIGGDDDWLTDKPRVDVRHYALTSAALAVAREHQQVIMAAPYKTAAGIVDHCRTEVGPREVPSDNQDVRLVIATYRLSLRR